VELRVPTPDESDDFSRSLRELAEAGRVRELRPGALVRASAAFRGDAEPWCTGMF
jgi:hypothetical protein